MVTWQTMLKIDLLIASFAMRSSPSADNPRAASFAVASAELSSHALLLLRDSIGNNLNCVANWICGLLFQAKITR
jgi:hypothetical protein